MTKKYDREELKKIWEKNKFNEDTHTGVMLSNYFDGQSNFTSTRFVWLRKNQYHKVDGPAVIEFSKLAEFEEKINTTWWINGHCIRVYRWAADNGIDLDNPTPEDIQLIRMRWE